MTRWRAFRLTEKISHELQTTTQASQLRCLSNLFLESWKQNLTSIGYPYWTVASFQFVFKIKDNWRERQLTVCNSVVAVPIVELPANVWTLKLVTASPWAPRSEKKTRPKLSKLHFMLLWVHSTMDHRWHQSVARRKKSWYFMTALKNSNVFDYQEFLHPTVQFSWLVVPQQTVFSWSMRTGGFEVQLLHQGFDLKTVRCSWSLMKKKNGNEDKNKLIK